MNTDFNPIIMNGIDISNKNEYIPEKFLIATGKKSYTTEELKIFGFKIERNISIDIIFSKKVALNLIKWKQKVLNFLTISIFLSDDGKIWSRLFSRKVDEKNEKTSIRLPLIFSKRIRLVIQRTAGNLEGYEASDFQFLLEQDWDFSVSSQNDRLSEPINVIDGRKDYGWISEITKFDRKEKLEINLKNSYYINQIMLASFFDDPTGFPPGFIIEVAGEDQNWQRIINETNFYTAGGSWHEWSFQPKKASRFRILILNKFHGRKDQFLAKILELKIFAIPENQLQNMAFSPTLASELLPGLVRLAPSQDSSPGRVVQGNDPRLWESTTEYSGITRLARDGEETPGVALQSSDSRIKPAQLNSLGIVQLADNGEVKECKVLQSNDSRIRLANEISPGIVQLAKNGESRSKVVVQGNDARLNLATEKAPGIVTLASHGETRGVVSGDDPRLRVASISWPGIVSLARHNEKSEKKVLMSDDPRLEEATELQKGRVILARDGEKSQGKVVQSHDCRLDPATRTSKGIVQFSEPGCSDLGKAVESNDPRLSDARKPLPHEHSNYALKNHKLNDHKGTLNLKINRKTPEPNGVAVDRNHEYPLSVENNEGRAAAFYGGVLVHSEMNASLYVAGKGDTALQVEGESTAIKASSRYGFAIDASGKNVLRLLGNSVSEGEFWNGPYAFYAWAWPKFSSIAFVEGDLLTVNKDGEITKASSEDIVIGTSIRKAGYIAGDFESSNLIIASQGAIPVRVKGMIEAGSQIGISDEPGVGVMVEKGGIGIALCSTSSEAEEVVFCVLRC